MKLITREIPGAWYDNKSILYQSDEPNSFEVEVTQATSVILMFQPYAPDEVYSVHAELLTLPDCLIVKVCQFTYILEPPVNTYRSYLSVDSGRNWALVDDAMLAERIAGRTPELVSETS